MYSSADDLDNASSNQLSENTFLGVFRKTVFWWVCVLKSASYWEFVWTEISIGIHQIEQLYSVRVCRKDVQKVLYGSLYALNTPSDHSNVCEKLRGQFIMTPSLFSFIFL